MEARHDGGPFDAASMRRAVLFEALRFV